MFTWVYVVVATHETQCLSAIRERLPEMERITLFGDSAVTTYEKFLTAQFGAFHYDFEFWTRSVARTRLWP